MADNPNPDDDCSCYQKTVVLRDWWLIKCPIEFQGKRFGVAGTQIADTGAVRVFSSCPIIKAFDVFTLEACDGVCIILRGFLNKQRLLQSGFLPQISREFIFGFPPCWESKCNLSFVGLPSQSPINKQASRSIISPCNNTKLNLEDKRRDKITVVEKNTEEEINDKVGRCSTSRDDNNPSKTNPGSEGGLSTAKSGVAASKDECGEVFDNQVISPAGKKHTSAAELTSIMRATEESQGKGELEATNACPHSLSGSDKRGKKVASKKSGRILRSDGNVVEHVNHSGTKVKRKLLDAVSGVQKNPTVNEGLNKEAKGNGVERDDEEIARVDGCGINSKKITSKNVNKESMTSEQRKGKLKVTKTSLSGSSKHGKNGNSKKSEQILKGGDSDVVVSVEPMTQTRSKVKDNLSLGKTIRKIDFDEEVTPEKDAKKHKTNNAVVSPDSLGQRRSRSGRVLVSPLEFWRNQVPVYDVDRNLIQVNEGYQTNSTPPSKGKGSVSRKPRR